MGILGNLLFGNRNKYNATVDDILNNTLQIETDNRINPNFSGVITYLGLIDEGWHHKASAQDTAIHIAIAYYMGMVKSDSDSDRNIAQALYPRLQAFIASSLSTRCVSQARADQFLSVIEKYNREYSPVKTTQEPRGDLGNNRIAQEVDKDRLWKEAQKRAEEQSATHSNVTVDLEPTVDDMDGVMEGLSALSEGDYTTAFRLLRPLADRGDAISQVSLGVLYFLGQGVRQDYSEAVRWYRKAAEQGLADAQYRLGAMYLSGEGVRQDPVEAAKWVRKAAEQGEADAQYNLGRMCAQGLGVPQDYAEAVRWFRKAADHGHALAQSWLATMYSKGMGVLLDQVLAYKWLNLAVKYWDASDVKGRVYVMHQLALVTSSMNPEQIRAGQSLVREWKPMG